MSIQFKFETKKKVKSYTVPISFNEEEHGKVASFSKKQDIAKAKFVKVVFLAGLQEYEKQGK